MNLHTKPERIHKGNNYFKYLLMIILITSIFLALYSIKLIGFVMLTVVIACVIGLLLIAFPRVLIFTDGLLFERKCSIASFSSREYFKYSELITVEYSPGRTDWAYLIVVAIFGSGGFGGNSKADQLILTTRDKKRHIINRFGKKEDFMNIVKIIESKI